MLKRLLNLATASILLLAVSACVASKEPLPLKNPVQFLPASALLYHDGDSKPELFKLIYNKGTFTVFEKHKPKGPNPLVFYKTPFSLAFYKIPGLPKGYHITWRPFAEGTQHEDNFYSVVWLEKSPSGRQQIVLSAPSNEDKKIIAKELNTNSDGIPRIKTTEELVSYAKALFKRDKNLETFRFDVYDLSNKDDYVKAEALAGAAFLAAKID